MRHWRRSKVWWCEVESGREKVGWLRDQARRDKVAFAAGRFGGEEIGSIDFVSSLNLKRSQTPRGERRKRVRANY